MQIDFADMHNCAIGAGASICWVCSFDLHFADRFVVLICICSWLFLPSNFWHKCHAHSIAVTIPISIYIPILVMCACRSDSFMCAAAVHHLIFSGMWHFTGICQYDFVNSWLFCSQRWLHVYMYWIHWFSSSYLCIINLKSLLYTLNTLAWGNETLYSKTSQ